jgi:hypothetical protein
VNNNFEALQLGQLVCCSDDSYLIFEGDIWEKVCKIATTQTTCVMDWLRAGMVVYSLKTEAMYFFKHDQVGFKIQVASGEIHVGTTMRVLGVIFDSKLSWESHITHISNIVKKKIHTLWKISPDLNPSELLGFSHRSIYLLCTVLCSRQ